MKKATLLTTLVLTLALSGFSQSKFGDVTLPESLSLSSGTLNLNGGGIREKLWMDMYVGGLYLTTKSSDAKTVIDKDEAMAIKLHIVSSLITNEKMEAACKEGFEKSTGGKTAPLADKIEKFVQVFREGIAVDDVYNMIYTTAGGTKIYKNKALKVTIAGLDFKQALFGIWLCDEPADSDLKEGMLGLE